VPARPYPRGPPAGVVPTCRCGHRRAPLPAHAAVTDHETVVFDSATPPRAESPGGIPGGYSSGDGYAPAFQTAFAHSANAMLLIELDRVIAAANRASEPLFGRTATSLVGMSWRAVLDDPAEAVDDREWRARLLAWVDKVAYLGVGASA